MREASFAQEIINNIDKIGVALSGALDSTIVGNVTQFTVSGTINSGDPVFLQGDEKIQSAYGKIVQYDDTIEPLLTQALPYLTDKIILLYEDNLNSNNLTAVVAQLNSAKTALTFGTPIVVLAANPDRFSMVVDTVADRIIFEYAQSPNTLLRVGSVSGTTITLGTAVTSYAGGSASTYGAVGFDAGANRVIHLFTEGTADRYRVGTTVAGSNSITLGTQGNLGIGALTGIGSVIYDPSSQRIVYGFNTTGGDSDSIQSVQITAETNIATSGATVAGGRQKMTYDSGNERVITIDLSDNLRTVDINPTFNTITLGAATNAAITSPEIVFDPLTSAIFVLDGSDINTATVGASQVITMSSEQVYQTVATTAQTLVATSSVLINTFTSAEGGLGYFIMRPHTPFVPFRFLGFSTATYTDGETGSINYFGINDKQTGLIPGLVYYIGGTVLTTAVLATKAGTAVSSTKILFTSID